jgi:hypothetical protein
MSEYTKKSAVRKRKKAAESVPVNLKREPLAVYDGQLLIGTFVEDETSGLVLAWDVDRKLLGRFSDAKAAANAISEVALAAGAQKAATQEALERINRPDPEFKSGWPSW